LDRVENIDRMTSDFKPVTQLFLEENYRSTGAILAASSAVIDQDPTRIKKTLRTSAASGQRVVLRQAPSAPEEASYVAGEIKRLIAYSGNTLQFSDFAILLRYNALSRSIEQALQSSGIPNRVLGGSKFFDRAEVRSSLGDWHFLIPVQIKDVLAYLQLVENPGYGPAFDRAINVPKRSIGVRAF
jgi:DNA helicase-2/ATP-dependent DNA helicase PcrA